MQDHDVQARRAALAIAARLGDETPEVYVTLGSGLIDVADAIEDAVDIPLPAIPGVPISRVPGHQSLMRAGRLGDRFVLAQLGRVHLYEGHEAADVVRMVEAAHHLGCGTFVVTNAAGGLAPDMTPGQLMLIRDHLNLTGANPLTGVIRDEGPVFVDMAGAYDAELATAAQEAADRLGAPLREGVYAGLAGPSYETPAEVAMLRTLGADAVGMSTVLEVIAARARGMRVLGLSTITNVHGRGEPTTHEEVLAVGTAASRSLTDLLLEVLGRI